MGGWWPLTLTTLLKAIDTEGLGGCWEGKIEGTMTQGWVWLSSGPRESLQIVCSAGGGRATPPGSRWPEATLNLFSSQESSLCWIQNHVYPLRRCRRIWAVATSPLASPVLSSDKSPSGSGGVPRAPGRESERCRHSLMNSPGATGWPPSTQAPQEL